MLGTTTDRRDHGTTPSFPEPEPGTLPAERYDTPDHRLARWSCSVDFREDAGWTVTLPPSTDHHPGTGARIQFSAPRERIPDDAVALVRGFIRSQPLEPISGVWPNSLGPEVVVPDIGRHATSREVIVAALAGATQQLLVNLPWVRLDADTEHLHKARVAVRRLRSDLKTFGPLLDDGWATGLREELRWFGGCLGEVRDLDVLLDTLAVVAREHPVLSEQDTEAVLVWFERERSTQLGGLVAVFDDARTATLIDELVAASRNPHTAPQADDPSAEQLPALASRPWRRLRRAVDRLGADSSYDELHAIRIRAKRARYAAEAVSPAAGSSARRFAKAMAKLQDALGELNDSVVIGARLRDAALREPAIAFPAGQLSGALAVRAERSEDHFDQTWARCSDKRLRRWW